MPGTSALIRVGREWLMPALLAWFGGYTFVNANRLCDAVALVSRDRDLRFTSYFLVGADQQGSEIADFRGKRFAFGSRLSTSGHLMPRHFLQDWKIDPEAYFGEVRYTDAHDKTGELAAERL